MVSRGCAGVSKKMDVLFGFISEFSILPEEWSGREKKEEGLRS